MRKPTNHGAATFMHYDRVKIGRGLWGSESDPHCKTVTPTANAREKSKGVGFRPPLGLIPANAFIMISLVFKRLTLR